MLFVDRGANELPGVHCDDTCIPNRMQGSLFPRYVALNITLWLAFLDPYTLFHFIY